MAYVTNAHLVFEVGTQKSKQGFWEIRAEAWEQGLFDLLDQATAEAWPRWQLCQELGAAGYAGEIPSASVPSGDYLPPEEWHPGVLLLSEREAILSEAVSELQLIADSVRAAKESGTWTPEVRALFAGELREVRRRLRARYAGVEKLVVRPGETLRSVLKGIEEEIFLESEEGRTEGPLTDHIQWFRQAREEASKADRSFEDTMNGSTEIESDYVDFGRTAPRSKQWLVVKPVGAKQSVPGLAWEEVVETATLTKLALERDGRPSVRARLPVRLLVDGFANLLVKKHGFLAFEISGSQATPDLSGRELAICVGRQMVALRAEELRDEAESFARRLAKKRGGTWEQRFPWCRAQVAQALTDSSHPRESWRMKKIRQLDEDIELLRWLLRQGDTVECWLNGRFSRGLVSEAAVAAGVREETGRSVFELTPEEGARDFSLLARVMNASGREVVSSCWQARYGGILTRDRFLLGHIGRAVAHFSELLGGPR